MRMYRYGDVNYRTKKIRGTARERLDYMTKLNLKTGCIEWIGAVDLRGYGRMADDTGWQDMVHRLSYKLNVGDIPKGLVVHHKCFNTRCVNPAHLELVTHRDNIINKGRTNVAYLNSKKTKCIRGHAFEVGSYYIQRAKWGNVRICKECHKVRMSMYRKGLKNAKNTYQ